MLPYIFSVFALFRIAYAIFIAQHQHITPLSQAQIKEFKPYSLYAAAAYCEPSKTRTWSCGGPIMSYLLTAQNIWKLIYGLSSCNLILAYCAGNPTFQPFDSGGDGSTVQFWYVGWDPTLSSVIVAHQGTDPTKFPADVTDGSLLMTNLDSTLFPGLSSLIQVHSGFAAEHAITAKTILVAVNQLLEKHSASSVTVVGHSLGAALALLDAVYLPLHLPAITSLRMVGYGMPRVGNAAFANYVDTSKVLTVTHVNNREDPVPTVPPLPLDFVHPAGEVHILNAGMWVACPGQDNPSVLCSVGATALAPLGNIFDHFGPYDDDIRMGIPCSLF